MTFKEIREEVEKTLTDRCGICGVEIATWKYEAADGDLMFNPKTNVPLVIIEGDGALQQRAALVCLKCDGVSQWSRREDGLS